MLLSRQKDSNGVKSQISHGANNAFPRQAGDYYKGFLKSTGADCLAIDDSISSAWAAKYLQKDGCIQEI